MNKLLVLLCLVYMVVPVDLIPDAIPVVGNVDDAIAVLIPIIKQQYEINKLERRRGNKWRD